MARRSQTSVDADVRPNRRRAFPTSLVECRWRDGNRILHNHGHGTRRPSYSFRRRRCRALHDRGGYLLIGSHRRVFWVVTDTLRRTPAETTVLSRRAPLFGALRKATRSHRIRAVRAWRNMGAMIHQGIERRRANKEVRVRSVVKR